MTNNRWQMNRAGLLNFWYYDEETFHFSDGKLLLRGANGSGKSVTMQSLLPVLLDGRKSPSRLDPFGSSARKMEDYLLGEKEISGRDERTGYLFLEYKKTDSPQYITTGIGLQARRGKALNAWHFVITDNRRIGKDLPLTKRTGGEDIPLSFQELKNRVGDGGTVTRSQAEYAALVRQHVFGFETEDAYEDLIKLLVQIRTPKLSKDFKPTVITGILESSLPPLTDEELRHLSDTIDSMDLARQQYDKQEAEYESAKRLNKAYHAYNEYMMAERLAFLENAQAKKRKAETDADGKSAEIENLTAELGRLTEENRQAAAEQEAAGQASERLRNHKVWNLSEELTKKEAAAASLEHRVGRLEEKWDGHRRNAARLREQLNEEQDQLLNHERDSADLLLDMQSLALDAAFSAHAVNADHLDRHAGDEVDFTAWLKDADTHGRLLDELKELAAESDRKSEEAEKLQRRSSVQKQEVDRLRGRISDLDHWFEEEKSALTDRLFDWFRDRPLLPFPEEDSRELAGAAGGLYDTARFDDVRKVLTGSLDAYRSGLNEQKAGLRHDQEQNAVDIRTEQDEIRRWQTMQLDSPDRPADADAFRQKLSDEQIPHLPFYAAVEFREDVTDEQRERLESALSRTGILDSLITAEPVKPEGDSLIRPEPLLMAPTLADYLMPDAAPGSAVSAERIDEVLRSIPLRPEDGRFHIDADGTYTIGILSGHAPKTGPAKYIGRTSREQHRLRMIDEAESRLAEWITEKERLAEEVGRIDGKLAEAARWQEEIPGDRALADIRDERDRESIRLEQEQRALLELDEDWKKALTRVKELRAELHRLGGGLGTELKPEPLDRMAGAFRDYTRSLHRLDRTTQDIRHIRRLIRDREESVARTEADMDELKGEQNVAESELDVLRQGMTLIREEMQLEGIEEIRLKINELQARLAQLDEVKKRTDREIPRTEVRLEQAQAKLEAFRTDVRFWTLMEEEWQDAVSEETGYGFIEDPAENRVALADLLEKRDKPKLLEQLTKALANEQYALTDYSVTERTMQRGEPLWFSEEWDPVHGAEMDRWEMNRNRRLIEMDLYGSRVSPYAVVDALSQDLIQQEQVLDEQERKLYEDIIMNTVSNILRARIQRTEKWVREMDGIMKSRNNSQGLIFSIKWKPLSADADQELDTADLVRLLRLDAKYMKEDDLNRIIAHFRSKIDRAKELTEADADGATMRQVLKDVLDYRKWFRFALQFRKENEPVRELTDHAFNKFSGGEKAMAMYIPLFTAAYSRYKEAADYAPYVISLDEAFAGVDDTNIRDMFEVVEQLGFDYIMNSQALWGDYDTVPSLSVYELIRQKNADFVSTIRYEWNGKERVFVAEEPEEEEWTAEAAAEQDALYKPAEKAAATPHRKTGKTEPTSEQAGLFDDPDELTEPVRHGR